LTHFSPVHAILTQVHTILTDSFKTSRSHAVVLDQATNVASVAETVMFRLRTNRAGDR
jgi:hypothetical protein